MADTNTVVLGAADSAPAPVQEAPPSNIVDTSKGGVASVAVTPEAPAAPAAARPANLPEKFKTVDDLIKSYAELEKKQGAGKPAEAPAAAADPAKPAATPTALTPETAAKAVADAGLDMAKLEAEYVEKGALSEETLTALEAKGLTRESINNYVEGQKARGAALTAEFEKIAGGSDNLKSVLDWAGTHLSDAEKDAYGAALDSGNQALATLMLRGMVAAHNAENGVEPKLLSGDSNRGSSAIEPFESQGQIIKAMSDPQYAADAAYRAKVDARVIATKSFVR